jgi:hypothetical protein
LQHVIATFVSGKFDQRRNNMQEHQYEDLYIPLFLLKQPHQPDTNQHEIQTDDFLIGIQGWAECFPVDECDE